MPEVTLFMPRMGESVMEATVIQWLKKEGDVVAEEESIVEVATDKVDSEVPTLYGGKIRSILVQQGEVVKIGAPLAIITTQVPVAMEKPQEVPLTTTIAPPKPQTLPIQATAPVRSLVLQERVLSRFYSPLVRHIAQQEHVSPEILDQIPGTGKGNRVTKQDVLAYLRYRPQHGPSSPTMPSLGVDPEDEVVQLDRVRQMIAARMVASRHTIPHVTSFVEADVTDLVAWRNSQKAHFSAKTNIPLTYTPLFIQAVVRALRDFPMVNALVASNRLIKKKAINIGVAVALPDGNLVVPVIRNADQLGLIALVQQVHILVHKARHRQLMPDELAGATYTISNIGSFQNLMGTPIIPQPQVAILALGAIVKKPIVIESAQGDTIAIRQMMYLSHAYDHRVIDGALGGSFVKRVATYLAQFKDWVDWIL